MERIFFWSARTALGVIFCTSKVNHNTWFISNHPCIMSWWYYCCVPRSSLNFSTIIHPDLHSSWDYIRCMWGLAAICSNKWFDTFFPTPSWPVLLECDSKIYQYCKCYFWAFIMMLLLFAQEYLANAFLVLSNSIFCLHPVWMQMNFPLNLDHLLTYPVKICSN